MALTSEERRYLVRLLDETCGPGDELTAEGLALRRKLAGDMSAVVIDVGDYDVDLFPYTDPEDADAFRIATMTVAMGSPPPEEVVRALDRGETPHDYDKTTVLLNATLWEALEDDEEA